MLRRQSADWMSWMAAQVKVVVQTTVIVSEIDLSCGVPTQLRRARTIVGRAAHSVTLGPFERRGEQRLC